MEEAEGVASGGEAHWAAAVSEVTIRHDEDSEGLVFLL